jgi:hypothetical protein
MFFLLQDAELAPMHGAKSFMEFIDKKVTRRPEVGCSKF